MNTFSKNMLILLLSLTPAIQGCATPPSKVEQTYGDSVRQMIGEQTYDHDAVNKPITTPALDGKVGDNVLDQHRTDIAKPDQSSKDIIFNIGNE